jgi:ankyrin repeat protein
LGTFLISHGADVNVIDHNGNTPLHNCSYHNSPKFATLLIKEGANVNIQTKNLETPLDYATENGHTDMIRVLIDAVCFKDN